MWSLTHIERGDLAVEPPSQNLQLPTYDSPEGSTAQQLRVLPNYFGPCDNDNISSKIVPLEKGVVIYGANVLSLLPVVLFVLPINVHV